MGASHTVDNVGRAVAGLLVGTADGEEATAEALLFTYRLVHATADRAGVIHLGVGGLGGRAARRGAEGQSLIHGGFGGGLVTRRWVGR